MSDYRIRIWKGRNSQGDYTGEPDETITVEDGELHIWKEDPRYHSPPIGLDIHPKDGPATLEVYTSESVRSPPGYESHVEQAYWNGPMEQGLSFPEGHDYPPFGCEVWGRVLFVVFEQQIRR